MGEVREDPTDRELAERAQGGGPGAREAFATLVRRHYAAVIRFVRRICPRPDEAEDLTQEAFLRAWAQIGRFRAGTNFPAWVVTIARFLVLARRKDIQRRPAPAPLHAVEDPPAAPLPEPLERLRRAVETLPPHLREIVALRFFDGLDYRAIAERTRDSEVALRSRLHDALEKLKSVLRHAPR
jgi:RNA polymerase sigma-70 factor (ECF subfamily)